MSEFGLARTKGKRLQSHSQCCNVILSAVQWCHVHIQYPVSNRQLVICPRSCRTIRSLPRARENSAVPSHGAPYRPSNGGPDVAAHANAARRFQPLPFALLRSRATLLPPNDVWWTQKIAIMGGSRRFPTYATPVQRCHRYRERSSVMHNRAATALDLERWSTRVSTREKLRN